MSYLISKFIYSFVEFSVIGIFFIITQMCFYNFKRNGKSIELNHDLKSFSQGIMFNFMSNILILISSIVGGYISSFIMNDVNTTMLYISKVSKILYFYIICSCIPYIIYTVTEVKHLAENIDRIQVQKFLKIYVFNGIVNLAIAIYIINKFKILGVCGISICCILIVIIFLLGMGDVLNEYRKFHPSRIRNIMTLFKSKQYRNYSKNQLFYNLKYICKGFKRLLV